MKFQLKLKKINETIYKCEANSLENAIHYFAKVKKLELKDFLDIYEVSEVI